MLFLFIENNRELMKKACLTRCCVFSTAQTHSYSFHVQRGSAHPSQLGGGVYVSLLGDHGCGRPLGRLSGRGVGRANTLHVTADAHHLVHVQSVGTDHASRVVLWVVAVGAGDVLGGCYHAGCTGVYGGEAAGNFSARGDAAVRRARGRVRSTARGNVEGAENRQVKLSLGSMQVRGGKGLKIDK